MKHALCFLLCLLSCLSVRSHEGMWMLNNLNNQLVQQMQALGLQLSPQQLYNPYGTSLKDAVVSFGGFCSGVVVSPDGLVFTNHHCGFEKIQQHSSTEHDYLKDGFVAKSREEELPNPGLYVSFLLRTVNVTSRVLNAIPTGCTEERRDEIVDSISTVIQSQAVWGDSTLTAIVSPYYQGNEYYLSVYRDYKDVRLVFAPPSSVGKFGGDTDNWEWPRQTGDFSIFRIYADQNNQPAEYSAENVPYHPTHYAPISLSGYKAGDFTMSVGYPGETMRYLSSYGIEERLTGWNAAMIQVRGVKQDIWRKAMDANTQIRIMYDSKYAESSNYWKNSQGMNQAVENLGVLEQKRNTEQLLQDWIAKDPDQRKKYQQVMDKLSQAYAERSAVNKPFYFLYESFIYASDIMLNAAKLLRTDFSEANPDAEKEVLEIVDSFKNIDLDLDQQVFAAMLKNYREQFPDTIFWPDFYTEIDQKFQGDCDLYAQFIYENSQMTTREKLLELIATGDYQAVNMDPVMSIMIDVYIKMQILQGEVLQATYTIEENERLLNAALREMDMSKSYYADANSTMRMSFGTIEPYQMANGQPSGLYCGPAGMLEKANRAQENPDYELLPTIRTLLEQADFGKYRDKTSKDLQMCFLSTNDITGGNSGSPIFNAKGQLLGLCFDGNWEAMSGDIAFNRQLQRCINVDVRFILFMLDKWGHAQHLLDELKLARN